MKFNYFVKVLVLSLGALSLAACSSSGKTAPVSDDLGQGGATATGIGAGSGFGKDGINEEGDANRLKAPYNQRYHFDFNKFDVKPDDMQSVEVQASYLAAHPSAKVRLEGNADDRGSREYNIALGWKRARAVGDILKQQGVAQSQIAMVSYGKEKPVAFGHNEESYKQNRRVDLIYEEK
jgi:peptidoglycan-associated lipoprotein